MEGRWEVDERVDEGGSPGEASAGAPWLNAGLLLIGLVCAAVVAVFLVRALWRADKKRPAGATVELRAGRQQSELHPGQEKPLSAAEPARSGPKGPREVSEQLLKDEAIEVAGCLVNDLPNRPEPLALLALAHNRLGDSAKAVGCWQRCLELDPNSAAAYDALGRIALTKDECEKAVAHFRKALAIDPKVSQVRTALADALMRSGEVEEAVAVLEEDLKDSPRNVESLSRLGQAWLQLKEYDKARERFAAAIEVDPACTDAYYGLSNVCIRLGEKEEAQKYREKFKELKAADLEVAEGRRQALFHPETLPEFVASICLAAGNVYSRHRYVEKAELCWRRAATLAPQDTVSRHQLALMYLQANRAAEALEVLDQLKKIEPENAIHYLNLGFLKVRLSEFDEAEEAFRTACKLAPKVSTGYASLAQLYLETRTKPEEARELAQTAVELEPTASNYFVLSTACAACSDAAEALAAIEKALKLDPDNAEYRRMRALIKGKE